MQVSCNNLTVAYHISKFSNLQQQYLAVQNMFLLIILISKYITSSIITHNIDLKIVSKCFIEQGLGLIVDAVGNMIIARSVIFCKKRAFIITKGGDIDTFAGEEMGITYQAADEDFNFFEA